jgi:hypothetical protein
MSVRRQIDWGFKETVYPSAYSTSGYGPSLGPSYDLLDGLMSYWTFDGASTTYAADPSYYGYDSHGGRHFVKSGNGPISSTDAGRAKLGGRGLQQDTSSNDHFIINTTDFRMSGDFTFTYWGSHSGTFGGGPPPTVKSIQAIGDWEIDTIDSQNKYFFRCWDSVSGSEIGSVQNNGGLVLITCRYNSTTKIPYMHINDLQEGDWAGNPETPLTNGLKQASTQFRILQNSSTGSGWSNGADELGIWNRYLSDEEVLAIYNDGNGLPYSSF